MSARYPIVLDVTDRRCLVVGGGPIAEGKVRGLLAAGARVTVVSPTLTPALAALAAAGRITHRARDYAEGDLEGAALALAATGDHAVSAAVLAEGRVRGVWVNAADDPERCDFFLPAVLRRGALAVAVSTGGASPALTRAVRDELERRLPAELGDLVEVVAEVRRELRERAVPVSAEAWRGALDDELAQLRPAAPRDLMRARLRARLEPQ
jgi:precorrin-2 dehydrogenase / sirohydrochlorin ferrochelatase